MQAQIKAVETAINELKAGRPIILTDDPSRENEGDLIIPAEKITPEIMNFMIRNGTGIVCMPLREDKLQQLNLSLMVASNENSCMRGTQFTVSVDAKEGITTGVSADDRTQTVKVIMQDDVTPNDIVKPGHMFPLLAKNGGVLERTGHTEGAVDLVELAGFKPAAVLCEVMNQDGTMASGVQLKEFALQHKLTSLTIDDIIQYRLFYENIIAEEASALVPLDQYGMFKMTVVKEKITHKEHVILYKEPQNFQQSLLVRVHSSCITGDLFSSNRCDCNKQLHHALQRMSQEGGMLIYLNQEGRGIGLFNKIKAYALQEQGFDTVEANEKLGLPVDSRQYHIAANILRNLQITKIRLLTNNLDKVENLKQFNIAVEREPIPSFYNEHNHFYLQTKKNKLKHVINFDANN